MRSQLARIICVNGLRSACTYIGCDPPPPVVVSYVLPVVFLHGALGKLRFDIRELVPGFTGNFIEAGIDGLHPILGVELLYIEMVIVRVRIGSFSERGVLERL